MNKLPASIIILLICAYLRSSQEKLGQWVMMLDSVLWYDNKRPAPPLLLLVNTVNQR